MLVNVTNYKLECFRTIWNIEIVVIWNIEIVVIWNIEIVVIEGSGLYRYRKNAQREFKQTYRWPKLLAISQ
jgi:hypothetical protein